MFIQSLSPKSHASRILHSSNNDRSLIDIIKEELRQALVKEEEYHYQLQLLQQQNQELISQQDVLHAKSHQMKQELLRHEEVGKVQKEKCEMLTKYMKRSQIDESKQDELNQLRHEVAKYRTGQQHQQQQYEEIYSKIKLLQQQCSDLKDQNRDLILQRDKAFSDKAAALSQSEKFHLEQQKLAKGDRQFSEQKKALQRAQQQAEQREEELNLYRQKFAKLEQLYSQKADSVDEFFTEAERKLIQERQLNAQFEEKLRFVYQEKQRLAQSYQELKEELENKSLENCDLQCQLQQASLQCEQLRRNDARFQGELQMILEEKERLSEQFESLQKEVDDCDQNGVALRQKLKQEQEANQRLQGQIHSLEEICYEYKQRYESSMQEYNQCSEKLKDVQERFGEMENRYNATQDDLQTAEDTIDELQQKLKEQTITDRHNSTYYVGSRLRYVTDQVCSTCYAKSDPSYQQSEAQAKPASRVIQDHSPVIWDPSLTKKIDNISPISLSKKAHVSGVSMISQQQVIKRTDVTLPPLSNKMKLNNSERNFNSLAQSCLTSQFNSQSDKENTQPLSTKTLDQLQQKYLNLRNRIHQKAN